MATSAEDVHISGLAKSLVQRGLLAESDVGAHQISANDKKMSLVSFLVANNILDSLVIASCASEEFGVPLFDLDAMDLDMAPIDLVSESLLLQHRVLPLFKRGSRLFIALSDPTNIQALDEIKFHTRLNAESILVEEDKLSKKIDAAIEAADSTMAALLDEDLDNL